MKITIKKAEIAGIIRAIPSKSVAHRMLICAALADRQTDILCTEVSDDITATARCMNAICADILKTAAGFRVSPQNRQITAEADCGESGSTFRFILPIACALGTQTCFRLNGRLASRPIEPLTAALEANGAKIEGIGTDAVKTAGKLSAGDYHLPADMSSQFISGLLFALPLLDGDSRIILSGKLASASYLDITCSVLAEYGIEVQRTDYGLAVRGNQRYTAKDGLSVEGDWSNAAFWLCAGAVSDRPVSCKGLYTDSAQGDKEIVRILREFGANVCEKGDCITVSGGNLRGISIDAENIPDLVPVLAAVACCAEGETRFYNAARLRDKESDRICSTASVLRAMGAEITETEDGLTVRKSNLSGAEVDSFGDHRIAMMAAVAAIAADGQTVIRRAEAVEKSYPAFFRDYAELGGDIEEEH